jgi:hypothetical protein
MANKSRVLEQSDQSIFFNVIPSPRDERDWAAEPLYDDVKRIPTNLDWRSHLQRVRNQGRQGTSLAFVGTCILEWYSRKILKREIIVSPQFIYNARPDKTQTLMSGRDLMETLKNNGCCKEDLYVYGSKHVPTPEVIEEALILKIDGYALVRTMETLKRALIVNGPCLICFPVYNHTTILWKQRKEQEKLGCHAMAVVGYNSKGFIVRNSWGEHWDTEGYCIYPYEDWGCHDEIWTVVNDANITKWKLRERYTIVKRLAGLNDPVKPQQDEEQAPSSAAAGTNPEENENENAMDEMSALPVPREKMVSSSKEDATLQSLFHPEEYQEFAQKDKIAGTNDMKKKSMVSKMFGSSVRHVPQEVIQKLPPPPIEDVSDVFLESQ